MAETALAMVFLLAAFFLLFQLADNLRAKLLAQYAAARCARARSVGFNDYMLLKSARVAMMPASGPCLVKSDSGGRLSTGQLAGRAGEYLECEYDGRARHVLDFEYWNDGRLSVAAPKTGARRVETEVRHRRPQFAPLGLLFSGVSASGDEDASLSGSFAIEAHYPDWMDP